VSITSATDALIDFKLRGGMLMINRLILQSPTRDSQENAGDFRSN
jgi:hypothetical protein